MLKMTAIKCLTVAATAVAVLTLAACSSSDDNSSNTQFNPDLQSPENAGEPGGDTTAISGLWNGSVTDGGSEDVIYWNISRDGVLTRYDYQQDGIEGASGDNCYRVGDPITVTPEAGTDYSIANVAVTADRVGDTLNINFVEEDVNDLDGDGDVTEMPSFSWPIVTTAVLSDLNSCSE